VASEEPSLSYQKGTRGRAGIAMISCCERHSPSSCPYNLRVLSTRGLLKSGVGGSIMAAKVLAPAEVAEKRMYVEVLERVKAVSGNSHSMQGQYKYFKV
jgi:hypothetical protein